MCTPSHQHLSWRRLFVATGALLLAAGNGAADAQVPAADPNSPFLNESGGLDIIATAIFPETRNSYWLVSPSDYLNAYHFAVNNGGMLWEVNSAAEQEFIIDQFQDAGTAWTLDPANTIPEGYDGAGTNNWDSNIWLGLTDSDYFGATEGTFQWISGAPITYENWGGGEPNDAGTGEDYAEMYSGGSWNDDNDRGSGLDLGLDGQPETEVGTTLRLPGGGGNFAVIEFPPAPLPAKLLLDPETGYAEIVPNPEFLLDREGVPHTDQLSVRSYEINANKGVLADKAWSGSNLTARQAGEPATGEGWDVVFSDDEKVFEASLLSGEGVDSDGSLFLGQVTKPLADDATVEDLGLTFSLAVDTPDPAISNLQTELSLEIELASVAAPTGFNPGDYNADGQVDAADYVVWRNTEGQTGAGLAADGNADGEVDRHDYALWAGNYGRVLGESSSSVPEPASLAAVWLGAVAFFSVRRGSRR